MRYYGRVLRWAALLVGVALLLSCAPAEVGTTADAVSQAPTHTPLPNPTSTDTATPTPAATETAAPTPTPTALESGSGDSCDLAPVVAPTPAPDPGYTRLDESTGLHVTGSMQLLELDTYRLRVTGRVEPRLELTYDDLRCLPRVEASPTLTCPGFFVDEATWAGTPIAEVLALTEVLDGATTIKFISADGYSTLLPLDEAQDPTNFLAYEWEGEPLPRLHGFPLRVVISDAQGNQWTKWVVEMEVQ